MTTEQIAIRPARLADAEAIARIHVETWRASYAGILPERYLVGMSESGQAFQWRKVLRRGGEHVLVAEAKDGDPRYPGARSVIGFGSAGATRSPDLPFSGEIFTLYVALDWQGRGVGRRLLGDLLARLFAARHEGALVWVLANNPSRFFYEKMGAQRAAERRESFAGELLAEIGYGWPDLEIWRSGGRF
ncbi:MAG: GNAT family N-acetyltransferase [Rhodovibrionaceae bacterium]|nr:GNAT family N-acetyltransferase [Rhodovibrionaceae bacterium]